MLAYLLSPAVAALTRRTGIRRGWAALTVCTIVVTLLMAGFWLIGSRLATEAEGLAAAGPDIAGAIARHDAGSARSAMRRHMDHAAKRFSTSWDKRKKK